MIVFGLAGLLVLICFLTPLASLLKIPFTFALSIAGAIVGYLVHSHAWAVPWLADYLDSLQAFEISSETILVVFLPVLLFESALAMNVRRLLNDLAPIMVLAVVAVFVCTLFVGWGVSLISTQSLATCLLLGAIVATTDPAAVVGIFKEVGAPKRLSTIVEGESLLNDAAAISLYSVLIAIVARGTDINWNLWHLFENFGYLLLGGAIAGYVIGRLACACIMLLRGWPTAEISLSVATAYISYIVPEHYFGVSGVVSTVVAGLVMSSVGRTRMSTATFFALKESWHQLGFWASSLIFLIAAMMIPAMLADATLDNVWVVMVMMVAALLARGITVFGLMPLVTTAVGTKVSNTYKTVIVWGGLRGAVSLALALSVTEHSALSDSVSDFVAIGAAGFVLGTLLINGITLRPLIKVLGLDKLTSTESALRDQAMVVSTMQLKQATEKLAIDEQINKAARQRISEVFDKSVELVQQEQKTELLNAHQKIQLGLAILARREFELLFKNLNDQGVDTSVADRLLSMAESMEESVKEKGLEGYFEGVERSLTYSVTFRLVMHLHYHLGMPLMLGYKLRQRFMYLIVMRWLVRRLISFGNSQLPVMLGEEASAAISEAQRKRLAMVEESLHGLRLQYPNFAEQLEQMYLGRAARSMERISYREMLNNSLITPEVYDDLLKEMKDRWSFVDRIPELDVELSPLELIRQVPVLRDMPQESIRPMVKLLKPKLVMPNQVILTSNRHHPQSMYFVVSGAVSVRLPDSTSIELGSGEFFGELQILGHDIGDYEAKSLGYAKLLELNPKDFRRIWKEDGRLRSVVEQVVEERVKAYQSWKKHTELTNEQDEGRGR